MTSNDDYVWLQTVKYASHETENSVWHDGQLKFIDEIVPYLSDGCNILDVGCGDGVSLKRLADLGYSPVGVDLNGSKLELAKNSGCVVHECDMHDLSIFDANFFDAIISSHSLEHCHSPSRVVREFYRTLKPGGLLFVVVPFPDTADYAVEAHVGRDILGTSDAANGEANVRNFFVDHNFIVFEIRHDNYRESELWIFARKPE
jgi:2-polyprenyl-3-methyl-5-hydroxy-6-metoxy-1,4-benzoquinol methylase